MGDHEDVGAGKRVAVEGALGVGEDVEVAGGEALGGDRVGGVRRVGGLHLLGEVAADGPRLGVGLVEEDARDLGLRQLVRSACHRL